MSTNDNLAVAAESFGNKLHYFEIEVDAEKSEIAWRGIRKWVPPSSSVDKCKFLITRFVRGAESWAERNGLGEQTNIFDTIGDYRG